MRTFREGPAAGSAALATCPGCAAERQRSHAVPSDVTVTSPEAAAALLVPRLAERDREHCVAVLLSTKHRVLDLVTVSVGTLDHTFMAPREIFRDALLANASALVVAHNHPSGDPEPSKDDEEVTRRLLRAGELIGVDLLDHLVIAGRRWVSLSRRGIR